MHITIELSTTPLLEVATFFATLLTAIGTISAVLLSLHLSRTSKNVELDIRATISYIIAPNNLIPTREVISVSIGNKSAHPVTISSVNWKLYPFSKLWFYQTLSPGQLPKRLEIGERTSIYVELTDPNNDWIDNLARAIIRDAPIYCPWQLGLKCMACIVAPEVGSASKVRVSEAIRKRIKEHIIAKGYSNTLPANT